MSHSIIFETKIVNLKDGRILHLDRSGCNNDNAGRSRDEFTGKIYTKEDFIKYAEHFINDDTNDYELQIGSKWSTYNNYGNHLLRMLKRAKTWDEYSKERTMRQQNLKAYTCLNHLKVMLVQKNSIRNIMTGCIVKQGYLISEKQKIIIMRMKLFHYLIMASLIE